jgi:uncharacterized cupredoxin-like copper-binding protein
MLRKTFFIFVDAIWLTGCAGAGASQSVTEIIVDATDFAYAPASITVPAGEPVSLTLKNMGKVEHDFVIDKINVTDIQASDSGPAEHHHMNTPEYDLHFFVRAGDTANLKFTAMEPGTYEIFCSIEGHKEAGMIGELIVAAQE